MDYIEKLAELYHRYGSLRLVEEETGVPALKVKELVNLYYGINGYNARMKEHGYKSLILN
jgi:hypothetical protein